MKVAVLGIQGSGKGTQAQLLSQLTGWPCIAVGDLLRDEIKKGTKLGALLKSFLDKGDLAPDSLMFSLLLPFLHQTHFILDGYPRTLREAILLDKDILLDRVIVLTLPDAEVYKRLAARRQCEYCHAIYGLHMIPRRKDICDLCGGKLFHRDDDQPEAIAERLKIYHTETAYVIAHYQKKGIAATVDATLPVEIVFAEIRKLFKV
ncbi:MAG: nucleoside monophosphate kinase [Nanoarchaeota archaeon]